MSLNKHIPYFKQLTYKSSLLLILFVLSLSDNHLISESIELQSKSRSLSSQTGPIARTTEDFHDFQVTMHSNANIRLNDLLNVQILLTVAKPLDGLHLNWSLQQNVQLNADSSNVPQGTLSIKAQEDRQTNNQEGVLFCESFPCVLEYSAEFTITGNKPHLVLQAYTLGTSGERLGTLAELFLVRDHNNHFVPPSALPSEMKFDPRKVKIIR